MDIQQYLPEIEQLLESTGSAQGAIYQEGQLVLDWQPEHEPVDVFAVQKGLLALLIGIAEEQYILETIDHINHHLDPEWTQLSPWDEAKLSIETLLEMTTGMDDSLAPVGEINQTWRYNNVAYQYLKQILTVQSGLSLQALSEEWLLNALGMRQTKWVEREERLPNGIAISGLVSTAQDLCQMGMLLLNNGRLDDKPLLPKFYLDKMLSPGPEENPAWSWGWWNNRSDKYIKPMKEQLGTIQGSLVPSAPDDLITARGAYGNYLFVLPSASLVIARTCMPQGFRPKVSFETALWNLLAQKNA